MAQLVLVTGTDPGALLALAARDYLAPMAAGDDPFASPQTMLVLRQGGLRDDLLRMAAARGVAGWFDPAIVVFAELASRLAPSLPRAVSAIERHVIIDDVLRRKAPEILGRTDRLSLTVREAESLFGELAAEGVSPASFRAACAALGVRDRFQRQRDDELLAAWEAYRAALTEASVRDGRDGLTLAAELAVREPARLAVALGGRRTLHIVGLMDLRGGWRPLLRALRAHPALDRVAVHTMHRDLLSRDDGLAPDAEESLSGQPSLAGTLFAPTIASPAPAGVRVSRLDAPDDRRAIEQVAVQVRSLVDQGVPPHRIAVVAREARPFVDRAADALGRMGVPVSVRQRVSLDEVPVVRLLKQLLDAAAENWTRHALVELAEHPYGAHKLDPLIINRLGYERRLDGLDEWRDAHATLVRRVQARDAGAPPRDEDERRRPLPPTDRASAALAAFDAFVPFAKLLDVARPLREWLGWLDSFLHEDPWQLEARIRRAARDDLALSRADLLGWTRLCATVRAWRAMESRHPQAEALDVAAFALMAETMLTGDVVLPVTTVHGVVVSEGLAVAYRAFDHLFVLGLEAGRFPRRRPAGVVLDDAERDALVTVGIALDQRPAWETRERELFRALVASARASLTLVWARTNEAQQDTVVSSYVEEVARVAGVAVSPPPVWPSSRMLVDGFPVAAHRAATALAAFGADIEQRRLTGTGGAYDGQIELPALRAWLAGRHDEAFRWSPTSLEGLAKCGYAWFAERLLRLESFGEPDDDIAATVRGQVLHDTLARFYDELRRRGTHPWVLLTNDTIDAALPVLHAAFDDAYNAMAATEWMGARALESARRAEWLRTLEGFVRYEATERSKWQDPTHWTHKRPMQTGVAQHEYAFGPMVFEEDGVRFTASGRIDRIEMGIDPRVSDPARWRVIVDYKSSVSAAPGHGKAGAFDDGIVVQAPLYALALRTLDPEARIARIEYRALTTGRAVLPMKLAEFDHKSQQLTEPEEAAAQYRASLAAIPRVIRQARTGDFGAAPAPSNGCPSWCVAIDVCRVRGGPQVMSW